MRQREPETKTSAFDPIALSLALWLGLMVGALGLQRMSEEAAAQKAAQQRVAQPERTSQQNAALPARPMQAFAAWGG